MVGSLACKRTTDPIPVPIVDGDIIGAVDLYDESTTNLSNEGMIIAVGQSVPLITGVSNINGEFILQDVPFGTYTLIYSKDGFGTYKIFDVGHQNSGVNTVIPHTPSLGQLSSTEVSELTVEIDGNNVVLTVTTNPGASSNDPGYIRLFYDDQFNVSSVAYDQYSDGIEIKINPFEIILTKTNLNNMGYASGTTVFAKVYGDSYFSNDYEDPTLGYRVFPNLNSVAAPPVSFVVP